MTGSSTNLPPQIASSNATAASFLSGRQQPSWMTGGPQRPYTRPPPPRPPATQAEPIQPPSSKTPDASSRRARPQVLTRTRQFYFACGDQRTKSGFALGSPRESEPPRRTGFDSDFYTSHDDCALCARHRMGRVAKPGPAAPQQRRPSANPTFVGPGSAKSSRIARKWASAWLS